MLTADSLSQHRWRGKKILWHRHLVADVAAVAVVAGLEVSVSVVEVLQVTGCFTSQADVGNSLSTGGSSWSWTCPWGLSPRRRLSRHRSRCPLPFPELDSPVELFSLWWCCSLASMNRCLRDECCSICSHRHLIFFFFGTPFRENELPVARTLKAFHSVVCPYNVVRCQLLKRCVFAAISSLV